MKILQQIFLFTSRHPQWRIGSRGITGGSRADRRRSLEKGASEITCVWSEKIQRLSATLGRERRGLGKLQVRDRSQVGN